MKHLFNRLGVSALVLFLLAFAMPSSAVEATKISDVAHSVFFRGGSGTRGAAGTNGGHYTDRYFNGNFTDYTYCNAGGITELVIDVSHIVTDPEGQAYVTDVLIGHQGNAQYSLFYTNEPEPENLTTYASDPRTWTPIAGADHVQEAGTKTYGVNGFATAVKYVFDTAPEWTTALAEVEVQGYEYVPPKAVKISALGRSIFFRSGGATRGNAGFNGGNYSDMVFDGNFNNPAICNMGGTTELVIPTTGLDDQGNDTGVAWYVTDFIVAHAGNSAYSLYYTTEAEPADILTYGADPRTWISIEGATNVQEQSLGNNAKVFGVNKTATAVKYVFNSFVSWTASLAEVEVWAMDPSTISCLHPNVESAQWSLAKLPTCTENGFEERFCPDCGERFERENSEDYPKIGHVYEAVLTAPGTTSSYGSGYVHCTRTNLNTNLQCDYRINFNGAPIDLASVGGIPINGVVQYTDVTASSSGGQDGGISPDDLVDNAWTDGWNNYWFAETLSHDEYAQFSFATTIELTKIEYSVFNQDQTVDFYKYDPATGEETLLKSVVIVMDESEGALGYQRKTVTFAADDDASSARIFVDAIRIRIGDVLDPATGEVVKAYVGTKYGRPFHTVICEAHPWGIIAGAGKLKSVADIGGEGYESIALALAAVTNEVATTIQIQKNTAEDVVIPAGRNITIDLNGCSITNVSSAAISVSGSLSIIDQIGGGEVVATGGQAAVANLSTNAVAIRGGTFTGAVANEGDGTITVYGGTYFDAPVPSGFAAPGLAPTTVADANGKYTVVTARTVTFDLGAEAGGSIYTNLVVATGETIAEPEDPTLEGYAFNEWRKNGAAYDFTNAVAANFTLVANWTTNQYDVLWMSDGALVASNRLDYGATVVAPDPAPAKTADAQYTWWFAGWEPAPDATVSSNATYTAVFTNTVNQYTVAFQWHDGTNEVDYDYGTAAADVAVPRDPPTYVENNTIYTFTGWSAAVPETITADVTITAQYASAAAVAKTIDGATTNFYASLRAAIDDAPAGSTVVLVADDEISFATVAVDERVPSNGSIVIDKALAIDGDGHTVAGVSNAEILNATAADVPGYDMTADLVNGSNLLGFFVKSGDVTFKNLTLTEFGDTAYVNKFGYTPIQTASAYADDLVIENVDFDKFNRTAVCVRGGTLTMTGGTVTANATNKTDDHFQQPIEVRGGTALIDGVTVESDFAYDNGGGAIVAWSATTLTNVVVDFKGVGIWADYPVVTVVGADTSVEATDKALFVEDGGLITVAAGAFNGALAVDGIDGSAIAVSGGTFSQPVLPAYCAEGYAPVAEPDAQGNYTVVRVYEVAFVLPNDSVVTNVPAGDVPVWPLESPPSKESTLEYDYFFVGWAPDEFETTPLAGLPPATQATNFWALFGQSAIEYRITLNLNDGELVGIDPSDWSGNERVYTVEDSFELPMPVKTGCEFVGWVEGEVDSPVASVWISCSTGDRVFSAVWEETLPPEIDLSDPETAPSAAEIATGAVPAGVQTDETTDEEEFVVCFHGKAGVTYQLQGSATLGLTEEQWKSPALAVGDAVRCTVDGGLVRLEFPMGGENVPDRMFFRVGASRTPAASGD